MSVDRLGLLEEVGDGLAADDVGLVLEDVDLLAEGVDVPQRLEVVDGLDDLLDGLDDDVDELLHLGRRPGELEGPHPAGHALDAVEDVVEAAGQVVDVLPLERRDEGVAELGEELVGDVVALVLDRLDLLVLLLDVLVVVDELLEGQGASLRLAASSRKSSKNLWSLGKSLSFTMSVLKRDAQYKGAYLNCQTGSGCALVGPSFPETLTFIPPCIEGG